MRSRLLIGLAALLVALSGRAAAAQADGGQFWVQLYDDQDGDGSRDENEPPVVRGVAAALLNEDGIVTAAALVDASANASRGLVGFQFLPEGDYTLQITSPEWIATTPTRFTRTIRPDAPPTVVEVGLRRLAITMELASRFTPEEWAARSERARVAVAGAGAAVMAGGMTALGGIIAAAFFGTARRRARRPRRAPARRTPAA